MKTKSINNIGFCLILFFGFILSQTTTLTVTNVDASNNDLGGNWYLYNSSGTGTPVTVASGSSTPVTVGNDYKLLTDATASGESFLHWRTNSLYYPRWYDYHCDDATADVYVAHFDDQQAVTFQSTGNVQFLIHDPWLVDGNNDSYGEDYFVELDELTSSGSYNAFKDVGGSPGTPAYPYYKVKIKRLDATTSGIYEFVQFDETNVNADFEAYTLPDDWSSDYYLDIMIQFTENDQAYSYIVDVEYDQMGEDDNDEIEIYSRETLTIPDGATLEMYAGAYFTVDGILNIGSSSGSSSIIKVDQSTPTLYWNGINLSQFGELTIENTTISDATNGIIFGGDGGADYSGVQKDFITLDDCDFKGFSNYAIYNQDEAQQTGNKILIENSVFSDDINIAYGWDGEFSFKGNTMDESYLRIHTAEGTYLLNDNRFEGDINGDAKFHINSAEGDFTFTENLFEGDPDDRSILFNRGSNPTEETNLTIQQNTFKNAYDYCIDITSFTGGTEDYNVDIRNNIIVGDVLDTDNIAVDLNGLIDDETITSFVRDYNNISGFDYHYQDITDENLDDDGHDLPTNWSDTDDDIDPEFIGGSPYDYNLDWDSPCINKGDPNLADDTDGSVADIGYKSTSYWGDRGDVNEDDSVDVGDNVLLVCIILENTGCENPTYTQQIRGDVARNGTLDVADITALVACQTAENCPTGLQKNIPITGNANLVLINSPSLSRWDGSTYVVSVNSNVPVRGIQADFIFEGLSIDDIELTNASGGLLLDYNELDDGSTRVIVYPEDEFEIPAGENDVMVISFSNLLRDNGATDIDTKNIVISDNFGRNIFNTSIAPTTPLGFRLNNPYPNPFNPVTTISYNLPIDSSLSLKVYDVMGREVAELVRPNTFHSAGTHLVEWDASGFSSGIYFVQLIAPDYRNSQKVMLLK